MQRLMKVNLFDLIIAIVEHLNWKMLSMQCIQYSITEKNMKTILYVHVLFRELHPIFV